MKMNRASLMSAVALSVVLTACGSDPSHSSMDMGTQAPAVTTGSPGTSDFNDADVAFAQGMIPHHQQAVDMADIALDPARAASVALTDLATKIKAAQDPEIEMMTGWLSTWGQEMMGTTDGHNMGGMTGMMSDEDMAALRNLTGADFDSMWLTMMIEHHQGAIDMAQTEKANGSSADALGLAADIITAQQAEIDQMTSMLG